MIGRLNTGQIVSGAGHIGLIGWALFGGLFTSQPLTFEVTEVTAISAEEYAALFTDQTEPETAPVTTSEVKAPEAPQIEEASPELASPPPDDPVEVAPPEPAVAAPQDMPPEVVPDPLPQPDAEVSDAPPVLEPPAPDVAVLVERPDVRPQARPAPRVAPEPVAQPDPDLRIDDVAREEATPAEEAEEVLPEEEATAPEEATTEIVTEADEVSEAAPGQSVRPRTRPARAAQAESQPDTQPEATSPTDSAVQDALAEALGQGEADPAPQPGGPPLTRGEKDALVVAVSRCWNVGSLSSDALRTTVVVGVEMNRDGTPIAASIRLLDSSGGAGNAVDQAFEAGRRAIIRCGASGFALPVEKFDQWRSIEMVFDPEKMRIK